MSIALWNARQLPFPVLIGNAGQTPHGYGILKLPTTLLIDPVGKLVKNGDLKMLAAKLAEKP